MSEEVAEVEVESSSFFVVRLLLVPHLAHDGLGVLLGQMAVAHFAHGPQEGRHLRASARANEVARGGLGLREAQRDQHTMEVGDHIPTASHLRRRYRHHRRPVLVLVQLL